MDGREGSIPDAYGSLSSREASPELNHRLRAIEAESNRSGAKLPASASIHARMNVETCVGLQTSVFMTYHYRLQKEVEALTADNAEIRRHANILESERDRACADFLGSQRMIEDLQFELSQACLHVDF